MGSDEIFPWVRAGRLDLADLLAGLDEHEWRVGSLCAGWTVRDVAAHMTMSTRTTLPVILRGIVRARGDFDRMVDQVARERAARFGPAELIAQLRETAGSRHRTLGSTHVDGLLDVLVHTQDIAIPLGRVHPMPTEPAVAALRHVVASRFYGARKRLRGTRLVATDWDFATGDGPTEIRATVGELLMLASGRTGHPASVPTDSPAADSAKR